MPIPRGRNGGRKSTRGLTRPPEIPREAWAAMLNQIDGAERRGVGFEMSPAEWWAWWQQDGRWQRRGRGLDRLCMARLGDVGPYAVGNVYCATNSQNLRDAMSNGRNVGGGRPRKLSDRDVTEAKRMLIERGRTFSETAAHLGVSRDTLYTYLPGGISRLKSN